MSPVHTRTGRITRHHFLRHHLYYKPKAKRKNRENSSASHIAKMLRRGHSSSSASRSRDRITQAQPTEALRRSSRKRRPADRQEYISYSDNEEDDFEVRRSFRRSKRGDMKSSQDEHSDGRLAPRREGLRPRRGRRVPREDSPQSTDDEGEALSDDDKGDEDEEDDDDDEEEDEEEEDEEEEEREEGEDREEDDREEDVDEDGEEQEGRRRYALRTRTEVQRFSPQQEERPISKGFTCGKQNREGKRVGSKSEKRHRLSRVDDSEDSLLIDEIVNMQGPPWLKGGSAAAQPWLFGGLDMSGFQNRSTTIAATGWRHHGGDQWASGIPTAGLSHKGGADIQPLQVDDTITFDQVGGLSNYVQSLKEMVFFPLLYPSFFQNYGIKPPRGVLLCGPPGTGKTLIARALAASATRAGRKINFYMRKGADVLSKWVGEAERQLRMLFEEAQRNQPSIIFFDEIDGLAPVRSSKQEQIHNSIVSTLLALMDGLDALGQVIVIGATNRVDAIDGALRRPGRFDRELTFSLPDSNARAEILKIHTRQWKKHPSDELCSELAAACVGYCGADLKALCIEAAIGAFRKKYPQVYTSEEPLLIDVNSVHVTRRDFLEAMSTITPAAQRGTLVLSMPLSSTVAPCLQNRLKSIIELIGTFFPLKGKDTGSRIPLIAGGADQLAAFSTLRYGSSFPFVYRPRLLLCGTAAAGLEHLGPAVLHELEKFPLHSLSLPSLLTDMGARTPEEAVVNIFREAQRTTPALLFLPQIELWWDTASFQLRAVLLMLLEEFPSNLPVLFLATAKVARANLEEQIVNLFGNAIYEVRLPNYEERSKFFTQLLDMVADIIQQKHDQSKKIDVLPELPKAPPKERELNEAALQAQFEEEQHAFRRLRMCFREVCNRLLSEKSFSVFHYPVTDEEAPDYHSVIQKPMDVSTLLRRTDAGHYLTCSAFLQDLELILLNAKAYHGEDYNGSRIVSKAHQLCDAAYEMLSQIDKELVSQCDEIVARGGPLKVHGTGAVADVNPTITQPLDNIQMVTGLRSLHPEVNVKESPEVHARRTRRSSEGDGGGESVADKPDFENDPIASMDAKVSSSSITPIAHQSFQIELEGRKELCVDLTSKDEKGVSKPFNDGEVPLSPDLGGKGITEVEDEDLLNMELDYPKMDFPADHVEKVRRQFARRTRKYGIADLEMIHAKMCQDVRSKGAHEDKSWVLQYIKDFVANMEHKECNQHAQED